MSKNQILTEMLQELIPFIQGDYFLSDGGLLGLTRNSKLIPWDEDLDLYLLPGSKIVIPKNSTLQLSKYYMDMKVSRKEKKKANYNKWFEFLAYLRTALPQTIGMNRAKLFSFAKDKYKKESIEATFSLPYIDIFQLEEVDGYFHIPFWTDYNGLKFTKDEATTLEFNVDLGFPVAVPVNAKEILRRQYGNDWETPNQNFRY
tara:strand:- start:2725 stop:3330 length:606 start_codon:yes stop_codon:yes gene_type:complete